MHFSGEISDVKFDVYKEIFFQGEDPIVEHGPDFCKPCIVNNYKYDFEDSLVKRERERWYKRRVIKTC